MNSSSGTAFDHPGFRILLRALEQCDAVHDCSCCPNRRECLAYWDAVMSSKKQLALVHVPKHLVEFARWSSAPHEEALYDRNEDGRQAPHEAGAQWEADKPLEEDPIALQKAVVP